MRVGELTENMPHRITGKPDDFRYLCTFATETPQYRAISA